MSPRALHLPGFDAQQERFRADCEIRPGLPASELYEEVLYTPATRETDGYTGGLFDRGGARVAAADLTRDGRPANRASPQSERRRVAGTGLYLG